MEANLRALYGGPSTTPYSIQRLRGSSEPRDLPVKFSRGLATDDFGGNPPLLVSFPPGQPPQGSFVDPTLRAFDGHAASVAESRQDNASDLRRSLEVMQRGIRWELIAHSDLLSRTCPVVRIAGRERRFAVRIVEESGGLLPYPRTGGALDACH